MARAYHRVGEAILDPEGFFDTGDVATIDPNGYMQITDRSKDVIKSGGEWISSIDIENLAIGHPAVAEAAVIGVAHPKWDERPAADRAAEGGPERRQGGAAGLPLGQNRQMVDARRRRLRDGDPSHLDGKIQKTALRTQFKDYRLPTA